MPQFTYTVASGNPGGMGDFGLKSRLPQLEDYCLGQRSNLLFCPLKSHLEGGVTEETPVGSLGLAEWDHPSLHLTSEVLVG